MKTLAWIAAGAAALGVLFIGTRARAATSSLSPTPPAPPPPKSYGETTRVALAVPAGWRRATSSEVAALPELVSQANAVRSSSGFTSLPYGTLSSFVASDGKTYATWIEQHYHEPGGAIQPWGYHHGVTLLTKVESSTLLGEWPGVSR